MTFFDELAGRSFIVESDPRASDYGHFVFTSGGFAYSPIGQASAAVNPSGVLTLSYTGPGRVFPQVSFTNASTAAPLPRSLTLSLSAHVDVDRHTADATLVADGGAIPMQTRPLDMSTIPALLDALEKALVANDGAAIYDVAGSDITSNRTRTDFAAEWATQSAKVGRILAMQRGEMSAIEYLDIGYATIRVAYLTDHMDASGAVQHTYFTVYLIHQKTDWKFWLTSSP